MKFVKFSIFALSMGLFVASCGDSTTDETTNTDTTAIMTTPEPTPPVDTTMAPPADTTMADTVHVAH